MGLRVAAGHLNCSRARHLSRALAFKSRPASRHVLSSDPPQPRAAGLMTSGPRSVSRTRAQPALDKPMRRIIDAGAWPPPAGMLGYRRSY